MATVASVATVALVFGLPGESDPGNTDLFCFDLETAFFFGARFDLEVTRAVALATLDAWSERCAVFTIAARLAACGVAPTSVGCIAARLGGGWLLCQGQ